jgi:hypothetical protein
MFDHYDFVNRDSEPDYGPPEEMKRLQIILILGMVVGLVAFGVYVF